MEIINIELVKFLLNIVMNNLFFKIKFLLI